MMELYSTNNRALRASVQTAVMEGLPADNGLYMPGRLEPLPPSFWKEFSGYSFPELAFQISDHLLQGDIPADTLRGMMERAFDFDAPLVKLDGQHFVLELFHGPSLAFKDFGARFMAQLMAYYAKGSGRTLHILVATSGDTGGAVAAGFLGTPGIEVTILYPSGKVSPLQEKQLTALGKNITAIEVAGTFDDCQAMVKKAFLDQDLRRELWITSANSINIARLIPQSFYYFRAFQQWPFSDKPPVFVVPSGNFGNLTAGLIARRLGLPAGHFVAATNANSVVPDYLHRGVFRPRPSIRTLSNAMDVGNPSNFARMLDLFGNDWDAMKAQISGYSFSDGETRAGMAELYSRYQYVMDPHGAVAYQALQAYLADHPAQGGIILETAHPAKFLEVVEPVLDLQVDIPERLARLAEAPKSAISMESTYAAFRSYLHTLK